MPISGESRTIELRGGGSLAVKLVGVSWMHFGEDERALFSAIADAMHTYEQKRREEATSADAVDPSAADPGTPSTRDEKV
jgi:hypothetical protein